MTTRTTTIEKAVAELSAARAAVQLGTDTKGTTVGKACLDAGLAAIDQVATDLGNLADRERATELKAVQ